MNPNIGYFIGGLVAGTLVGGICGWIVTKKRDEKILEDKIREMSDEVAKVDPFAPKTKKAETKKSQNIESEEKTNINYDDVANLVRENKNKSTHKINYSSYYDDSEDDISKNQENIFDLMKNVNEVEDDEDEEIKTDVEFHKVSDLHSEPVIITSDEAGDVPENYESEILFYYVHDDVVVDEYDDEVSEPERLVGNLLESSGFKKNIERHLYVKNPRLNVIYDIQKVFNPWEGKEGGV